MKSISHILLVALVLGPCGGAFSAPLSGTNGSNLTAYNPNGGAINNNEWNSMMNSRSGSSTAATADFGNCNSLILRCASPKCANGGCTSIEVATPIVAGCVASNAACKQYGDELTQYIAAQLVANSTAKANAQMAAAQNAAAEASAMQMQQMQAQMQQMQQEMASQNAQQIAQLQSALEQQQRAAEAARAEAAAAASAAQPASTVSGGVSAPVGATMAAASATTPTTVMEGLTEAQRIAANAGVSADILAREQVAGQIMTAIERAQVNLNKAKAAMQDAFTYAGCTTSGDNCVGPKRVSVFRQKAMAFFDPYDAVLDELYDALVLAQSVGVDITDIYMMLNGSCNVWGEYLCNGGMVSAGANNGSGNTEEICETTTDATGKKTTTCKTVTKSSKSTGSEKMVWATYDENSCPTNGGQSVKYGWSRGLNKECYQDTTIPPEDSTACTLNRTLSDMDEVQRNFLFSDAGDMDEHVRIGCASSALENSKFFRNRKKGSSIDIETLQRMISQDAPAFVSSNKYSSGAGNDSMERYKYCALTSKGYTDLERAIATKKLPAQVCVRDSMLRSIQESNGRITAGTFDALGLSNTGNSNPDYKDSAVCERMGCKWDSGQCVLPKDSDGKPTKRWVNGACL